VRTKTLTLAIVCAAVIGALLGSGQQPSSGQQFPEGTRKPACGCYICGSPLFENFEDQAAAKPCAGILSVDACPVELAKMPKEKRDAFCQKVKTQLKFNSFRDSCPVYAASCEPDEKNSPPEAKCEKPNPWFDPSSDCSDVQSPQIAIKQSAVSLSICGSPVFRYVPDSKDPLLLEAYQAALRDWVRQRVGSKICCNKFSEAARSGKPCNPQADLDCDGKSNQTDVVSEGEATYPDINNLFSTRAGAAIDPFPVGLDPDDPDFMPESTARKSKGVGECACKWELIKGDLKCSPDGKQQHVYTATWRCPSTKAEVFTTKYVPATKPCS
jgi:hypothetical protein